MKAIVRFHISGENWEEVRITGPDSICNPVLKYLLMQLVNSKKHLTLVFDKMGEDL